MGSQPVPSAQDLGNLGRLLEIIAFASDPAAKAAIAELRKERDAYDKAMADANAAAGTLAARLQEAMGAEATAAAIQEQAQAVLEEARRAKAQADGALMQAGAEKTAAESDRQAAGADRKVAESVRRKAEADLAKAAKVLEDANERAGVILEAAKGALEAAETTRAEIDAKLAKIRALAE